MVGGQLPGRPGPVVAARHLPRRHPARPPVRLARRPRLHTAYAADGTGPSNQSVEDPRSRHDEIDDLGISRTSNRRTGGGISLGPVDPWSAEAPRLYQTPWSRGRRVRSPASRVPHGPIDGDQLLVNGRQVIFSGMNRHETHPDRGRVFDADHARADLVMMKRHASTRSGPATIRRTPGARPGRRAGLLGDPGVRPGDPRLRLQRLAGQPERRPRAGRARTWTGSSAPSSGTRTTRR